MAVKNESSNIKLYICMDGHGISTSYKTMLSLRAQVKLKKSKFIYRCK